MMMLRTGGDFVITCDECGDTLETDTDDFAEAKEFMQQQDWHAHVEGKRWLHRCMSCQEGVW